MQESEGLDPLGVIARAWRLLAVGAILGALVVAAGVSQLPKSYSSTVLLHVTIQQPISIGQNSGSVNEDPARQVATQQQLVKSDEVVGQVATLLKTTATHVRNHIKVSSDTTADTLTITGSASSAPAAQLLAQTVATTFVNVSHEQGLANLNNFVTGAQQQYDSLSKQAGTTRATDPNFTSIVADLDSASSLLQSLKTAVAGYSSPVSIVTNADTPSAPSGLGAKKAGVLGLLIGLIAGGIGAFARAGRAASGGSIGRLVAATGAPLIASLPTLTDLSEHTEGRPPSEAALDGGRAAAAALSPAGNRTVLLTGPGAPGQRPLVARLVAEAAAAAGRRTTLVDADLRRPARGAAPGLTGLLRAQNRLSTDVVRMGASTTNVNNLSELRSGPDPAMALDLLRGPALPPILAALHLDSELVLIDGPSLESPEVRAVAEAAGDVVVVVTSTSRPEEVEAGIASLRASGAHVLGLIELTTHRRLLPTTLTRTSRGGAISLTPPEGGAPVPPAVSKPAGAAADPRRTPEPAMPRVSLQPTPETPRPQAFTGGGRPDDPASWRPAANGWVPHVDATGDPRPAVTSVERDTD